MPKVNTQEMKKTVSNYMGYYQRNDIDFDQLNKYCGFDKDILVKKKEVLTALYMTYIENNKKFCLPIDKIKKYSSDFLVSYAHVGGLNFTESFIKYEEVDRYKFLSEKVQNHIQLKDLIKAMYLADKLIDLSTGPANLSEQIKKELSSQNFMDQIQNIPSALYEAFVERLELKFKFQKEELDENFYMRWEKIKQIFPEDLVSTIIDQIEQIKVLDTKGRKLEEAIAQLCTEIPELNDEEIILIYEAEIIHKMHKVSAMTLPIIMRQYNTSCKDKQILNKTLEFYKNLYSEFSEITDAIDVLLEGKILDSKTEEVYLNCLSSHLGYYFTRIDSEDILALMVGNPQIADNIKQLINSPLIDSSAQKAVVSIYQEYKKLNPLMVNAIQYLSQDHDIQIQELTQENKLLKQQLDIQQKQIDQLFALISPIQPESAINHDIVIGMDKGIYDIDNMMW